MKANTYRESLEAVLAQCRPLATEQIPFGEVAGRVLAEAVRAAQDDPAAPKSAMDGFALRAGETEAATPGSPVEFDFDEVVGAGHTAARAVTPGRAIRVMTGALLPGGADAVVKQEDSLPDPGRTSDEGGSFAVTAPLRPGENVIPRGARFTRCDPLLPGGAPLSPQGLGLLAGLGLSRVRVHRKPRVGVLALGDELVQPGVELKPGQIDVSNLHALLGEVQRYGGEGVDLGIAPDDADEIERRLRARIAGRSETSPRAACDILLTLGGTRKGDFDFVDHVLGRLGARLQFRRTLINWGGSTLFATLENTLLFGLPGTPLASWMASELLVRPALWRLAGRRELEHPLLQAQLTTHLRLKPGRRHFIPARLRFDPHGAPLATPLGERPTAELPYAALADGLIHFPEETPELGPGDPVTVAWLGS